MWRRRRSRKGGEEEEEEEEAEEEAEEEECVAVCVCTGDCEQAFRLSPSVCVAVYRPGVNKHHPTWIWYALNSGVAACLSATARAPMVWLWGPPCRPGNTAWLI